MNAEVVGIVIAAAAVLWLVITCTPTKDHEDKPEREAVVVFWRKA